MKSSSEQFRENIWLIEFIRRRRAASLKEIQAGYTKTAFYQGQPLTRASFNRHKDQIEDSFGIHIMCNRKNGYKYTLEDEGRFRRDSIQGWLISTMSVSSAVSQNTQLEGRILLEMIPSAGDFLDRIMEAMNKGVTIRIRHQKYGSHEPQEREIEPYCVKLWNKRWYVLGRFISSGEAPSMRLYSLDRIQGVELTKRPFRIPGDFSCKEYFNEYFGVLTMDEIPVQNVLLRTYGNTRFYLRDLPLHPSQKMISVGEDFIDYALTLRPTPDFCNELLSYGDSIQVLSPESLKSQIRDTLARSLEMYE